MNKIKNKVQLHSLIHDFSPPSYCIFLKELCSSLTITYDEEKKNVHVAILSRTSVKDIALTHVFSNFKVSFPAHHLGNLIRGCTSFSPTWKAPYRNPSLKSDGDISWRLLHHSLSSPSLSNKMNTEIPPSCPFCAQTGTLIHMFIFCPSLDPLGNYLSKLVSKVNQELVLDMKLFLFHNFPNGKFYSRQKRSLTDFILTLAKSTIYKTYMNHLKSASHDPPNYLVIFQERLRSRIRLDFQVSCVQQGNGEKFNSTWEPLAETEDGNTFIFNIE
jgi:hypothetical protein